MPVAWASKRREQELEAHRIAIANSRITSVTVQTVSFRYTLPEFPPPNRHVITVSTADASVRPTLRPIRWCLYSHSPPTLLRSTAI